MRILVVNHRDSTHPQAGGLEQIVHQTGKYWVQWGHEVDVLCAGFAGSVREEKIDGMRFIRGPSEYFFHWWAPLKVRRMNPKQYDVILEYISKVPCLIPFAAGTTPVAVMIPHLFGRTIFEELSMPASLAWIAYEKMIPSVYRRSHFWVNSQSTARDLAVRSIPPEKISVIYAGLPPELFVPDPHTTKTPYPSLIYIGRLKRYKHIDHILHAMTHLLIRFPDLRLRIVGRGDAEKQLRALAASLGVTHAVDFCGYVDEAGKKKLLQESWVAVQTSSNEGWGLAVTEAGACSVPTVASDSPGLRESVRDGETGYVVPHGNAHALAAKIEDLLLHSDRRAAMGSAARTFASQFSWEMTARNALEFLQAASVEQSHASPKV